MNKHFLKILLSLGLFGSYVVDNDGAGGGGDLGDVDIGDEGDDPGENSTGGSSEPDLKTLQEQLKSANDAITTLKEDQTTRQRAETHKQVLDDLKSRHPDFDAEKIKEHLVKLHSENPEKAESLNNAVGFELLYLQNFAPKSVNNDEVEFGRNNGGIDRSAEIMEKISNGGRASLQDKKALLGKFL